jgi:hypothetical protein
MSGYDWTKGKSRGAVEAEENGLMTATAFAALARKNGFPGCTAADVKTALEPREWHHSSKFFNKVNYFARQDLGDRLDCDEDSCRAMTTAECVGCPTAKTYRQTLLAEIASRKRWTSLLRQADRLGLAWFLMDEPSRIGERWHSINRKYPGRGDILIDRLEKSIEIFRGQPNE